MRAHDVTQAIDMGDLTDNSTLKEASDWLVDHVETGAECPCCRRFAKIYLRPINSGMALAILTMFRAEGLRPVHTPTVLRGVGAASRNETMLRYWQLLEQAIEVNQVGWWRVTSKGKDWIEGRISVPRYARVWEHELLNLQETRRYGESGKLVSFEEAFGSQFDLDELLSANSEVFVPNPDIRPHTPLIV